MTHPTHHPCRLLLGIQPAPAPCNPPPAGPHPAPAPADRAGQAEPGRTGPSRGHRVTCRSRRTAERTASAPTVPQSATWSYLPSEWPLHIVLRQAGLDPGAELENGGGRHGRHPGRNFLAGFYDEMPLLRIGPTADQLFLIRTGRVGFWYCGRSGAVQDERKST